jgi:hypothetical protein
MPTVFFSRRAALCLFGALGATIACASVAPLFAADAFGVPISNQVVAGTIVLPDGDKAQFWAREGTLITVRNETSNSWYGFVARIKGNQPGFTPYRLELSDGRTTLRQLGKTSIGRDNKITTREGPFRLQVSQVSTGDFPDSLDPRTSQASPAELQARYGASGGGSCCVTCKGVTLCSSASITACGSCEGGTRLLP